MQLLLLLQIFLENCFHKLDAASSWVARESSRQLLMHSKYDWKNPSNMTCVYQVVQLEGRVLYVYMYSHLLQRGIDVKKYLTKPIVQHCFGPIPTLEFVQSQMIWPCLTQKLQIHQLLCLPKSAHYLYSDIYQPLLRRGQIICFYTNSNAEIGPKQCQTSGLLRYFFLHQCLFARSVDKIHNESR